MLDIQLLRKELGSVVARLKTRGAYTFPVIEFEKLEAARKQVQIRAEELQAKRKLASKEFGEAKAKGLSTDHIFPKYFGAVDPDKEQRDNEEKLKQIQHELSDLLLAVPNLPRRAHCASRFQKSSGSSRRVVTSSSPATTFRAVSASIPGKASSRRARPMFSMARPTNASMPTPPCIDACP